MKDILDTGQSDCMLIRGDNKNYLIDTGAAYYSDKIISYLNSNGINTIDMLILTHYHDDHYEGMLKIKEGFVRSKGDNTNIRINVQ
ncbi:MBL fold metallo-hydrolase [Clostridium sp. DJ247]|uniref:MBL fold metallo-hydrolase n=1 Tax=Clostridium sp. DJ247 TaxID=2726188 RepID=UPI001629BEAC|nr:MBL fold metallo-hydrolase [Clostridium sp. DJ247]MBC2579483.1 MBL fold metallo-hydrolase [Clostridium sp. DJ247]